MVNNNNIPVRIFKTVKEWEAWLAGHYNDPGVWFKFAKKSSGLKTPSYADALETAIAYGWIDSQRLAFDHKYYLQKFTPRGSRSVWSKINREKAEALIKTGKMKPSGLKAVEQAKASGEWDKAYEPQSRITVPADFQSELDNNKEAAALFLRLSSAERYSMLFRLQSARTEMTRKKMIAEFMKILSAKTRASSVRIEK